MSYPQVAHRKRIEQINAATGVRSPAIECLVWLRPNHCRILTIPSALLALTDENESDVFIEAAETAERRLAA